MNVQQLWYKETNFTKGYLKQVEGRNCYILYLLVLVTSPPLGFSRAFPRNFIPEVVSIVFLEDSGLESPWGAAQKIRENLPAYLYPKSKQLHPFVLYSVLYEISFEAKM